MSIKYFGWAPKIPWKVEGGFLQPELPLASWGKAVENRSPIVVCNGGLLEAFYSLMSFELINKSFQRKKSYWSGPSQFHKVISLNGLASIGSELSDEILDRFPTPVFMDKVDNVYLNTLHNYIFSSPVLNAEDKRRNYRPLIKQISRNLTQPWSELYLPEVRNWGNVPAQVTQWCKVNRFDLQRPFVLILPDVGLSIHPQSGLSWTDMEIKSLAAMLNQSGVQTLVCTNRPSLTQTSAWFCKAHLDWIFYFAYHSKAILSEEIDMLLIGMTLNPKAKIIGRKLKNPRNLKQNAKFLERSSVIYESEDLTPYQVFQIVMEKNG